MLIFTPYFRIKRLIVLQKSNPGTKAQIRLVNQDLRENQLSVEIQSIRTEFRHNPENFHSCAKTFRTNLHLPLPSRHTPMRGSRSVLLRTSGYIEDKESSQQLTLYQNAIKQTINKLNPLCTNGLIQ